MKYKIYIKTSSFQNTYRILLMANFYSLSSLSIMSFSRENFFSAGEFSIFAAFLVMPPKPLLGRP